MIAIAAVPIRDRNGRDCANSTSADELIDLAPSNEICSRRYRGSARTRADLFRWQPLPGVSSPKHSRRLSFRNEVASIAIPAIPTEPIGSIPRPPELIAALVGRDGADPALDALDDEAIGDTIAQFDATGSPVVTDGEQRKYHNFWTYSVHGLPNTAPDGFAIPFAAGHTRRMSRLTGGPFRYRRYADAYLDVAQRCATVPVKQAVISPSALSLMYPADELPGYTRKQFIDDLIREHETEVRACLRKGAHQVQIDFTEGRLAVKIDPSGGLLHSFIDRNNLVLARFGEDDRKRIGVHTCPGGDCDSTHSADVDYADLLPALFGMNVGNFSVALAGEPDRVRVLELIRNLLQPHQRTTDDCGFAPFCDDTSTSRGTAFAMIRSRVSGTALASDSLGVG